MKKKAQGFGKPVHQSQEGKYLQRFAKKFQKTTGNQFEQVMVSPAGMPKMSEIFQEFIDPYSESANDYKSRIKLLEVAAMAWNLAILPEADRQLMLKQTIQMMVDQAGSQIESDIRGILDELMARKLKYFADCKRLVVDFNLEETRSGFQLSVASTMEVPEDMVAPLEDEAQNILADR
jgi:hypothetical protein